MKNILMKKNILVALLCAIMIFSGLGCKKSGEKYELPIEVWGTFDNSNAFSEIFDEYAKINKSITAVNYRKVTLESYKKDLLNGLAAGNGPDVFMIQNSWLPDFQDKIVPVSQIIVAEDEFRKTFVDVVAEDMIVDGQIYGVPLSVDSLGLYYNKDIFNAAGITRPPQTWEEFDKAVQALTEFDEFGNIKKSGAAMGTSYNKGGAINVNKASDILALLMIQNGASMSSKTSGIIDFGKSTNTGENSIAAGEKALEYYVKFASAGSNVYTWDKGRNYSIDEFFEGKTAMTINYSYHYDTIKAKNEKLNFAVTDVPQISLQDIGSQANYANYWVFVVAKNKVPVQPDDKRLAPITDQMRVYESWQFLRAMTFPSAQGITLANAVNGEKSLYPTEFDFTEKYLTETGKPAARRDIIEKQKNDVRLGAFARGNLIARTWRRHDADAVDAIFYDMIDRVNTGQMSSSQSISLGEQRAQQLQN